MFPCKPSPDKSPLTEHGFKDASTDPRRINAYWNANPGASIGIPTGERSGLLVLDVDHEPGRGLYGFADLERLEREHGKLPRTLTARTPRGGEHRYFRWPEGARGWDITRALEIKAEGQYVLAPPSTEYEWVVRAEIAEAPAWLVRDNRRVEARKPAPHKRRAAAVAGGQIPEGSRNRTLFFEALKLKDAGRGREDVLAEVLAINVARCSPPLDAGEVEKIVGSAFRYPVRSGNPSPEVLEAVEKLETHWWERTWPGMGGKTDRDVYRVLIELARRYGRVLEDGSVAVSASVRSVALAAATRFETVSRGATKRLAEAGLSRKLDGGRNRKEAATWALLPQASPVVNTQHKRAQDMPCVDNQLRPRLWDLSTPAFRWTGHVKKGRAAVLYVLEAHGPKRLKELADLMGWGNHRELKRRYVEPLVGLGLVEDRDGVLALPERHAERVEEIRRAPYTTVSRRRRESKDTSGRTVRWVEETENTASEVEREEKDRRDAEKQREAFRLYLLKNSPEADEGCRALLNAWDREQEAAEAARVPGLEDGEIVSERSCIHHVPGDPSMSTKGGTCWLCHRREDVA